MATPKNAAYKLAQKAAARAIVLANNEPLRRFQKRYGISAVEFAKNEARNILTKLMLEEMIPRAE